MSGRTSFSDFIGVAPDRQTADLREDVEKAKQSAAQAARIEEIFRKIEFLYDREMKRANADYQTQMEKAAHDFYGERRGL